MYNVWPVLYYAAQSRWFHFVKFGWLCCVFVRFSPEKHTIVKHLSHLSKHETFLQTKIFAVFSWFSQLLHIITWVIYDRVRNKKKYFWILNEELQEQEIQMKTKTLSNTTQVLPSITLLYDWHLKPLSLLAIVF